MKHYSLNEHEYRLREMGGLGFIVVDTDRVNLDDVCNSDRPGAIVRVWGDVTTAIRFIGGDDTKIGCVAGWISEEE